VTTSRRTSRFGPSTAIVLLALSLLAAACSGIEAVPTPSTTTTMAPQAVPLLADGPGRYEATVTSGDALRRFVLVVPERILDPAPLLLVFHGFTGSPADVEEQTGFTELAEEHGFLVAYPEGEGRPRSWRADPRRGDRDVEFVRDLVAAISAEVLVDPGRVYAAGMSNGGAMAARLACDASDVIAAVGTVAAPYPLIDCEDSRPVPLVAFHGTADLIVPYEGVEPLFPRVEDWLRGWADRPGCDPDTSVSRITGDVTLTAWTGCRTDVALYTVLDGRHGWPGPREKSWWGSTTDSADASEVIWQFLAGR